MNLNLSLLNEKYRNISFASSSSESWSIVRVADPEAESAYRAILNCWNEKFLGYDHFGDLRSYLRDAYVALRSAVGPTDKLHTHFEEVLLGLREAIIKADNFLSENERFLLGQATTAFEKYSRKNDYPLTNATLSAISESSFEPALVLNGREYSFLAMNLLDGKSVYPSIPKALAVLDCSTRNHVVLVAAPDKNLPINQMRLLTVGGFAVKVTFIVPNWWSRGATEYFNSNIWFGLDGENSRYLQEVGALSLSSSDLPNHLDATWDYSVPAKPLAKRLEKYENSGPIECSLLILDQGLVMPVEVDATRIAVIRPSVGGLGFGLDYTTPEDAVKNKDVVFSFAQVSERSFIKEQAERLLGPELPRILEIQDSWRDALNQKGQSLGWAEVASRLAAAGVEKAHRVRWWGENPNFIRPQMDSDFLGLLKYLGFQGDFIGEAFDAAKKVNGARETAGTAARKALAGAISEQIWSDIQKGTPSEIALDEMGEASFMASKVQSKQIETVFAGVLQVRRLLGGI